MRPIDADALHKDIIDTITTCQELIANKTKEDARERMEGNLSAFIEVAIRIKNAPTITLKEYAKAEGYSLIKREPMPKLKPCPQCGASGRKIEEWVCRTGYFYICSACNHQSKPARSERKARENWNETNA